MSQDIIDIHVHLGSPKDEESGCYWSDEFAKGIPYYSMLLITKSLFKKMNLETVQSHITNTLESAKIVDKIVILGMDEVYDEQGNAIPEHTHLHTPNDYLIKLSQEYDRILFGCSVHPYRNDWEQELEKCIENKTVLCKWIPSSQQIDLTNEKCIQFYKKLAEYDLPLLCHAGPEHAIPTSDHKFDEWNNPKYLETALEHGVKVIVAHCAMPYWDAMDDTWKDEFWELVKLFALSEQNDWELYADLSAICTPTRSKYVKILKEIVGIIPHSKLLFASDYPVPIFDISFKQTKNPFKWIESFFKTVKTKNPLDKNYKLIKSMGFDDSIFTNFNKLMSDIKYPT